MKKLLSWALNEKDVENFWRAQLMKLFPNGKMTSPFNTDGYLEDDGGKVTVLFEAKYEQNLNDKLSQVSVLSQTLFYLKKFEKSGQRLPRVVFIADKNEAFAIHTNSLVKYLDFPLDWNSAASSSSRLNPELIAKMAQDESIVPFVFNVIEGFNFVAIQKKILSLSHDVKRLIKITGQNITSVYEYFEKNVLVKNKLTVNETANLFINLIINPEDNYLHPVKKHTLVTKSFGPIQINGEKLMAFLDHFDGNQYSMEEKENLTSIVDRLIEDETRRRKGEFFTPTIWVDEAHKMITQTFGENWKDEYVVWDCASGTLNLTRDYSFKELYCSTIEASDLQTADQMGYNPEAVKFQYDFLNDGIVDGKIDIEGDTKLPEGLKRALLEGKKMIVFMNPPYGRSGNNKRDGLQKVGISNNFIGEIMKSEDWGGSSSQLYTQFLFRLSKMNINNINICIFAKSLYKTGSSFNNFRINFYKKFEYVDGMLFSAAHFDGVSDTWGIDFSIWRSGVENRDSLSIKIMDLNTNEYEIDYLYDKSIYHTDNHISMSEWANERFVTEEFPKLSNSLVIKDTKYGSELPKNCFATLISNSNNVAKNAQSVYVVNGGITENVGKHFINKSNIFKLASIFTARKSITGKYANWVNDKDEYMAPDESHPLWEQFQLDSIVYSLFNTSSNQSSLRQIDYKDKKWDIKNEFFWMSKSDMLKLASEHSYDELYRDARTTDERHVYNLLHNEDIYSRLSPDAREVLDMATELVKKSFPMRKILNEQHPEYHLNTWDAGWYQIKLILKKFYPADLIEFGRKYKAFEDRMRPLVYEVGFLRK
jgi:hypothetical protein